MAKIIFKNQEYVSGKHFKIFDISLTGIGILIPNNLDRRQNPMIELEPNESGKIGIIMKGPGPEKEVPDIKKIFNKLKIVRINKKFNQRYILIGCQFAPWERNQEEDLGKFIHQLQLFEIRHLQKY
jgi:c-di-GMP-binding flagellar brake protein YcgR